MRFWIFPQKHFLDGRTIVTQPIGTLKIKWKKQKPWPIFRLSNFKGHIRLANMENKVFSFLISNNLIRRRHFYKSIYEAEQNTINITIVFTCYQFHTSFSRRVAVFHDISQHFWGWFRHFHTISPLSAIFCGKWRNWATIKGYSWVLGYFRMPNKLYAFLLLTSFCCK